MQETYVRAMRFSHRFQPGTHLRAWLFQILRNTFLTFYRLREREVGALRGRGPGRVSRRCSTMRRATTRSGRRLTWTSSGRCTRLPEEFKTLLLLAEVEGLPLEDVARIMGCPIGTVKSRIFRAKERLRGHLKDYGEVSQG